MSEFSESYHLHSDDQREGTRLLESAGLSGFVFRPQNGRVAVLAENCQFSINRNLVRANRGVLLHYAFAEDHGWGFEIVHENEIKCQFSCAWDDDIHTNKSRLDIDFVRPLITTAPEMPVDTFSLHRFFNGPTSIDELVDSPESPAYTFAKMLGLSRYSWFSYDYLCDDFDPDEPEFEGVIEFLQE